MKRVKVSFFVGEKYMKEDFKYANSGVLELESYEERLISREKGIEDEYTFERLWESALEFANGLWHTTKGAWGMLSWSFVMVFEGLRWLWKGAFDMKKDVKKDDKKVQK
jgi:hypothetical protein